MMGATEKVPWDFITQTRHRDWDNCSPTIFCNPLLSQVRQHVVQLRTNILYQEGKDGIVHRCLLALHFDSKIIIMMWES